MELCVYSFKKQSPHLAPYIAIPEVYWKLSTSRLFTMEYMEGIKITDVQQIKKFGLRPSDVAKLISQAFVEMIFSTWFCALWSSCCKYACTSCTRKAWFFCNVYRMEKATSTCPAWPWIVQDTWSLIYFLTPCYRQSNLLRLCFTYLKTAFLLYQLQNQRCLWIVRCCSNSISWEVYS